MLTGIHIKDKFSEFLYLSGFTFMYYDELIVLLLLIISIYIGMYTYISKLLLLQSKCIYRMYLCIVYTCIYYVSIYRSIYTIRSVSKCIVLLEM